MRWIWAVCTRACEASCKPGCQKRYDVLRLVFSVLPITTTVHKSQSLCDSGQCESTRYFIVVT